MVSRLGAPGLVSTSSLLGEGPAALRELVRRPEGPGVDLEEL